MKWIAAVALAALALGSCSRDNEAKYNTTLQMQEVMGHVLNPAAQAFWARSGEIIEEDKVTSRVPTTDEEWLIAENSAATLVETANILMLPGRAPPGEEDWIKFSQQLSAEALEGLAAADARDGQRMFDVGGRIYVACEACHEKYQPEPAD